MNSDINEWPPPSDPSVFESLCLDLWKDIWQDAGAQKNGRRGQKQDGVDIFGKKDGKWIGVQCKQKDGLLRNTVTVQELEEETNAARNFRPALQHFIVATTGRRDSNVQERARQLTNEHGSNGSFTVDIWSWQEIWAELTRRRDLLNRIGQQYWPLLLQERIPALHQLLPLPSLVGREDELLHLEKHLGDGRRSEIDSAGKWLNIHGMGGVGKTALATALAYRVKGRFPDAQIHLDLRSADTEKRPALKTNEAMQAVIAAFRPNILLPANQDELAALYRSILSNAGRVLLLLDNAADEKQLRELLPPPNCLLLVTSRQRFCIPNLTMHQLDCLQPQKSEELLLKLAPRVRGAEKEAAALSGHLPLALLVVAGMINLHSISKPEELLADLRNRRKNLDEVDAVFQMSYELLTAELRLRWRQLAVFPGSFDLWAVTAVWGAISFSDAKKELPKIQALTQAESQQLLQTLVNGNLIEWNEHRRRFRLHTLVRQFAQRNMSDEECSEAQYRHAAHFCDLLHEANKSGDNVLSEISRFNAEFSNIHYAHHWAISRFQNPKFAPLNASMRHAVATLCWSYPVAGLNFFRLRVPSQVRLFIYEIGLQAARATGNAEVESSCLTQIGTAHSELGQNEEAIRCHKLRLENARSLKDLHGECTALGNLSLAHLSAGDIEVAGRYNEIELFIRRKLKDRKGEGSALGSRGLILEAKGDHVNAIEHYIKQQTIAKETDDLEAERVAVTNMGVSYLSIYQYEKAIECHERAEAISRTFGDLGGEGSSLLNLANVFTSNGKVEMAIPLYTRSIECKRASGNIRGVADAMANLGRAYLQQGDFRNSKKYAEAALGIYEQIHDPRAAKLSKIILELRKRQI